MSEERLELRYVPVSSARKWDRNAKKHDIQALIDSIKQHGFKDPPKFEPELNGGEGGTVEGNGRCEALAVMMEARMDRPRGIVEDAGGEWLMPFLFGVDAPSQAAAESYGLTHNIATMLGGDFSELDIAAMWDLEGYAAVVQEIKNAEVDVVGVSDEGLTAVMEVLAQQALGQDIPDEFPEYDESIADTVEYHECPKCNHKWPK